MFKHNQKSMYSNFFVFHTSGDILSVFLLLFFQYCIKFFVWNSVWKFHLYPIHFLYNGISNFVGYLMPNLFLLKFNRNLSKISWLVGLFCFTVYQSFFGSFNAELNHFDKSFKQFSLAYKHSFNVKNSSISNNSV